MKRKKNLRKPSGKAIVLQKARGSWMAALPKYIRIPLKAALIACAVVVCFIAFPALVLLALAPSEKLTELKESSVPKLALLGFTLFLCLIDFALGVPLYGVLRTGDFCWKPATYAELNCVTFASAPIEFSLSIFFFWPLFWLCATAIIFGFRHLMRENLSDAQHGS